MMTRKSSKILKLAKGLLRQQIEVFKTANQAVMKSLKYACRPQAQKRDFRKL